MSNNSNKRHAPRHNKISLTHDKGGHAESVLKNNKVVQDNRPPSRAWCNGVYLPLHSLV